MVKAVKVKQQIAWLSTVNRAGQQRRLVPRFCRQDASGEEKIRFKKRIVFKE